MGKHPFGFIAKFMTFSTIKSTYLNSLLSSLLLSCFSGELCHFGFPLLSNGKRTEWSPIRSVIIRVINKIGRPRSGSPICLITRMITDRIGRHEVLLPINHMYNKIREKN